MPRYDPCNSIHHNANLPDDGKRFAVRLLNENKRKHGYGVVCSRCYPLSTKAEDLSTFATAAPAK